MKGRCFLVNLNKRLFDLLYQSRRTQKDLAEALGISERNVSSWKMRGSDPPANLIVGIAAFFGISVECFLTGEEHAPASNVVGGNVDAGAVVQQGSSNSHVFVSGGGAGKRTLSDEESELLRLFSSLDVKRRIKILDLAFKLEDEARAELSENE